MRERRKARGKCREDCEARGSCEKCKGMEKKRKKKEREEARQRRNGGEDK